VSSSKFDLPERDIAALHGCKKWFLRMRVRIIHLLSLPYASIMLHMRWRGLERKAVQLICPIFSNHG